jgi:hypothetical protein
MQAIDAGEPVPLHVFGEVANTLFGWLPTSARVTTGAASGVVVVSVFSIFGVVLLAQVV